MSEKKLRDYLQTPRSPTVGSRALRPVILSDSKGNYLKDQVHHPEDRQIVWWNKRGTNIKNSLHWLEKNIKSKIKELGNIHIYIWLGTCDLTTKNKNGTISLATQHFETSKNIFEQLQKFKLLLQPYPNSRITFIEIPHYSITKWNSRVKKSPTEDRINQDQELHEQIVDLNTQIQDLNSSLNVRSPLLNLHLKASKQVKRGKSRPRKQYINYQLYLDGIHPKPILAKAWLAEVSTQIRIDCWH